jgi:hypothetical protein
MELVASYSLLVPCSFGWEGFVVSHVQLQIQWAFQSPFSAREWQLRSAPVSVGGLAGSAIERPGICP